MSRVPVEIRNCQTWVRECIGKLAEEGVVDGEAVGNVGLAPVN